MVLNHFMKCLWVLLTICTLLRRWGRYIWWSLHSNCSSSSVVYVYLDVFWWWANQFWAISPWPKSTRRKWRERKGTKKKEGVFPHFLARVGAGGSCMMDTSFFSGVQNLWIVDLRLKVVIFNWDLHVFLKNSSVLEHRVTYLSLFFFCTFLLGKDSWYWEVLGHCCHLAGKEGYWWGSLL